ncbi:MAG: hypothetical protein KAT85_08320, partial [candidate division Zixibacteria bacterium]|nr:hypothetical protein [candidate division Zixibacteria bacterium]
MDLLQILKRPESADPIVLEPTIVELPGDLETPVAAYLKLEPIGAKFLLESAEDTKSVGRYTFIGIAPKNRVDIRRDSCRISGSNGSAEIEHRPEDAPFTAFKSIL